jgi:hypothetical protein
VNFARRILPALVMTVLFCAVPAFVSAASPHGGSLDNAGGPDGFGYRFLDNQNGDTAHFHWRELRGDEEAEWLQFESNDDDYVLPCAIGFDFPFYGYSYDTAWVSTNGNLQFATESDTYANDCLPSGALTGPAIFGLWDDLDLSGGGYPGGGNRTVAVRRFADCTVIEFDSVGHHGVSGTSFKFEFILTLAGAVRLLYNHLVFCEETNTQTIGLQGGPGSPSLQYVCEDEGHQPLDGLAVGFYHISTGALAGQVRDNHGDRADSRTRRLPSNGRRWPLQFSHPRRRQLHRLRLPRRLHRRANGTGAHHRRSDLDRGF